LIGGGLGAVGGGVGGGIHSHENHDEHDEQLEGAGIALGSTLVGAGLGYLVCSMMEEEEPKPAPRRAAPTPAPTPPPQPAPPPRPDPCTGVVRLEGVTFANDKSDVTPQSAAVLDETITLLQRCPEKHVRLSAYTDSNGSDAYNQALSQRRADSVRTYLIDHGVDADRIESRGFGEADPVASNDTPEGRAENRRVEIQPLD
jgi:OOP family OmpA-OmpF porin